MAKFLNRLAVVLTCKAYQAKESVKQAAAELKSDERGLSGVVVAVLLILVAVLAVVLLWGLLGEYIKEDLWPRITGGDDALAAS